MFVVNIEYTVPLDIIETIVGEHRAWLDIQYDKGLLLCSGPKTPRNGGIIIVLSSDIVQVKELFAHDPYNTHKAAKYSFIEFTPVKYHKQIQNLL